MMFSLSRPPQPFWGHVYLQPLLIAPAGRLMLIRGSAGGQRYIAPAPLRGRERSGGPPLATIYGHRRGESQYLLFFLTVYSPLPRPCPLIYSPPNGSPCLPFPAAFKMTRVAPAQAEQQRHHRPFIVQINGTLKLSVSLFDYYHLGRSLFSPYKGGQARVVAYVIGVIERQAEG